MVAASPTGRVLIADDEERIRTVTCRLLKHLGHEAVAVEDGDRMVEELGARPDAYRLVLLDLGMPGPEGPAAIRALRAISPDARVVVSTGELIDEVRRRFAGSPPDGYLQKPYSINDLRALLASVLS